MRPLRPSLAATATSLAVALVTAPSPASALAFATAPFPAHVLPVDLELSLLVDVSGSVSSNEYLLQRQGYVDAFRSPALQSVIRSTDGGIAANLVYWSGASSQRQAVGWTHITDTGDAESFADAIEGAPRPFGGSTAPGSAIAFAAPGFVDNGFESANQVIDVSGDGVENSGLNTSLARDNALANGIDAINGLVIGGSEQVFDFYRREIQGGNGSFTVRAEDFSDFAEAVQDKIVRETVPVPVNNTRIAPTTTTESPGFVIYRLTSQGTLDQAELNPKLPTIVVTHGWQPNASFDAAFNPDGELKSRTDFPLNSITNALQVLHQNTGLEYNVITYMWEEAYTKTKLGVLTPIPYTDSVGAVLSTQLEQVFAAAAGPGGYDQPIHFIGHSYGTLVNASAINMLRGSGLDVRQATLLDPPVLIGEVAKLLGAITIAGVPVSLAIPDDLHLRDLLYQRMPEASVGYVDNFYNPSFPLGGFGGPVAGAAPDGGAEILVSHMKADEKYANIISNGNWVSPVLGETAFLDRPSPKRWDPPFLPSLVSLGLGIAQRTVRGTTALLGTTVHIVEEVGQTALKGARVVGNGVIQVVDKTGDIVREFSQQTSGLILNALDKLSTPPWASERRLRTRGWLLAEASPSMVSYEVDLPVSAAMISFKFLFSNPGDGDWLSLHFDDQLLWSFLGVNSFRHLMTATVPLLGLGGQSGSLYFTLNSVGEQNASVLFGDLRFYTASGSGAPNSVPAPPIVLLLGVGLIAVRQRALRSKSKPSGRRG